MKIIEGFSIPESMLTPEQDQIARSSGGAKVEREHLPTYRRLQAYLAKHGTLPPLDEFAASIAWDHQDPENPVEAGKADYYPRLKKAGL